MEQQRRAASRRPSGGRTMGPSATDTDGPTAGSRRKRFRFSTALPAWIAWGSVATAVVVLPLLVDPRGRDSYRLPKEAFMVASGIVITAAGLLAIIFGAKPRWRALLLDRPIQLIMAIVLWTGIAVLTSTNRPLSERSLIYVVAFAAFAAATYLLGRSARLNAVRLVFIAAIPNCVLYLLEEFRLWNPFATAEQIQTAWFSRHIFSSAMIGNPDDVGGYLLPIAIVAATLAVTTPARAQRLLAIAAAVLFGLTLVATQSWAAIGAYGVSLSILFALTLKTPARAILLSALIGVLAMVAYPPFRARLFTIASTLSARRIDLYAIDLALSNRLTPFAAAVGMVRDHPLTGVGPGSFGWHYYGYKVMFENAHPEMRKSATAYFNFAETHSDHLQTLAVSGIPGYALFVYAVVLVARCSRRRRSQTADEDADPRREFSRLLGLPIAVAFAVHTLPQFPLELASVTSQTLFVAALCVSWSRDDLP